MLEFFINPATTYIEALGQEIAIHLNDPESVIHILIWILRRTSCYKLFISLNHSPEHAVRDMMT